MSQGARGAYSQQEAVGAGTGARRRPRETAAGRKCTLRSAPRAHQPESATRQPPGRPPLPPSRPPPHRARPAQASPSENGRPTLWGARLLASVCGSSLRGRWRDRLNAARSVAAHSPLPASPGLLVTRRAATTHARCSLARPRISRELAAGPRALFTRVARPGACCPLLVGT